MNLRGIKQVLSLIQYREWRIDAHSNEIGGLYLQVSFEAPCTTTGGEQGWKGRKWTLSEYMTKSEIVTTAFKAVLTAEEHEARENFLYRGFQIFGPHIDVELLVDLHQTSRNVLDVRANPGE